MPLAGSTLGHYQILGLLGAGGMGEVYRARDPRLGREVALKILGDEDASRMRRFEQEARAASALNHPNIVAVYDIGREGGVSYIVSELVDGESLRRIIERGPVALRTLLDLATQIADGLAAAHQAGIVHRDLKPENIMVTREGRVKILDFGIAKGAPAAPGPEGETVTELLTAPGVVLGTTHYMSPEQAAGGVVDFRSDQFAFGLLLYEMVTGKRAFARETPVLTLAAIITEEAPALDTRVPPPVRWVIERCLAKEPRQRYGATIDLYHELRNLRDRSTEAFSTEMLAPPGSAKRPRRLWLGIGAGAAVLGAAVIAGLVLAPGGTEQAAYRYTPLATEATAEGFAAWSPDGKTIAYSADIGGVYQIFTRSLDAPLAAQLTRADDDCLFPFWSPDGTRVFYISGAMGEPRSLWSIGAAGGEPERVVEGTGAAAISPDGAMLAFLRGGSLWVAQANGSGARKRADLSPSAALGFLRFSADGTQLAAWVGNPHEISHFWLLPWPGEGAGRRVVFPWEQRLSPGPRPFTWLAGGREIAFEARPAASSNTHLWIANLETGATRELTSGHAEEIYPAVSPDGKRLAYTAVQTDSDILEISLEAPAQRPLLATPRYESWPAWSPAGPQIAFSTNRSGSYEIWLKSMAEGWERPLVTGKEFGDQPSYFLLAPSISPDGRRIAFQRLAGGSAAVWVSAMEGGPPVRPAPEPDEVRQDFPTWSPDGNWIAYLSNRGGKRVLAKARVGGAGTPVVVKENVRLLEPKWSPQGDWIAVAGPEGLMLVPPDGGASRALGDLVPLSYGWSKDGKVLYAVTVDATRRLSLFAIDPATGRATRRGEVGMAPVNPLPHAMMTTLRGFSLAPDGRSFAASIVRPKLDIWILDGLESPRGWLERLWSR